MEKSSVLVGINISSLQGQRHLGTRWSDFIFSLHDRLQNYGIKLPESNNDLLFFSFNHPYTAITSVLESLTQAKKEYKWQASMGAVPIQIIIHMARPQDPSLQGNDISASAWENLEFEILYLTRSLKQQWATVMADMDLPEHNIEMEGEGLFRLDFKGQVSFKVERLFKHRAYPLSGKHKPCFYCGMASHEPAACPVKYLDMEQQSLSTVGYLSLEEINTAYKDIFANLPAHTKRLAAGLKPAEIRADNTLQVFVAYFDLSLVFQPRFLWNMAFSINQNWDDIYRDDKLNVDSRALQMGLDCLRVGNYAQAEEMLEKEFKHSKGKNVYAAIGLAFLVLEKGEGRYMPHYLQKAAELASVEKERVYASLLLARYYDLKDDLWQSDNALNNALAANKSCLEARYCKVQIAVRSGFGIDHINDLRIIIDAQQEFFITALLDPALKSIEGLVEDMLSAKIHSWQGKAERNLNLAKMECEELVEWCEADDNEMQVNLTSLTNLQERFAHKSYFGLLEVVSRAQGLVYACRRARERKTERLYEMIRRMSSVWEEYSIYWQKYSYQTFFQAFIRSLAEIKADIGQARSLSERRKGNSYKVAVEVVAEVEKKFGHIRRIYKRMVLLGMVLGALKNFGKYLIVSEVAVVILLFILLPVLGGSLGDAMGTRVGELFRNSLFQKQCIFFATTFIAPIIALILTYSKNSGDR